MEKINILKKIKRRTAVLPAIILGLSSANINLINVNASSKLVADSWIDLTSSDFTPRSGLTSVVIGDKIYCIGGEDNSWNELDIVEAYDLNTGTWETKASMTTPRDAFASVVVEDKIYCIGGYNNDSGALDVIEVYDPQTDKWETKTSMTTSRYDLTASVVNGKIYCIGGEGDNWNELDVVEVYDPETDSWETKTSMPTPRENLTSAVIDNKIYVIGGEFALDELDTVEMYDPETDKWETKANMPTARDSLTSSVVNGEIYCIGGEGEAEELGTLEIYNPETNTWKIKTAMPTARDSLASVAIDGKIYVFGGEVDIGEPLNNIEMYTTEYALVIEATESLERAEDSLLFEDIENARDLVNQLPESLDKENLQSRLDNLFSFDITLDKKSSSANVDIYIKSENMLSMTLSTNSITFEDYSGVDDLEKTNAINISINSSLPYQLNAYLIDEIYNVDKDKKIDIDRLNIKDSDDNDYKEFTAINEKLVLKDDCESGNNKPHNIDIMLKGGNAYEADIYKTVIKFEAEQK